MKKKQHLEQKLCAGLCSYYKPGKNEELACRGYTVAERLMEKGNMIIIKASGEIGSGTAEIIVQKMCSTCEFHEHDCDYMADRAAPPCGGFILLAHLLAEKKITIEDLC